MLYEPTSSSSCLYVSGVALKITSNSQSGKIPRDVPLCPMKIPTLLSIEHHVVHSLRSLDMSHNNIEHLPGPAHWTSLNLRELFFSHNQISTLDLSEKPHVWSRVEKLHLSHNKLKEVRGHLCLSHQILGKRFQLVLPQLLSNLAL